MKPAIHVDSRPVSDADVPSIGVLFAGIRLAVGNREKAICAAPDMWCHVTSDYPGCVKVSSKSMGKFFLYRWSDKTIVG